MTIDFNIMNSESAPDEIDVTTIGDSEIQTAYKPYDLDRAKAAFTGFKKQIDKVHSSITGFEIKTDADAATFTETVGVAKRIINSIEATRKKIIADPDKFVRSVNSFVRGFRKRLEDVERLGKNKIGQYNYRQ